MGGITYITPNLAPSSKMSDTEEEHRTYGGGNGGGDGSMDNLEKRVGKLEEDVADIKLNIAILTTRSESFATKADVAGMQTVMAETQGNLRREMSDLRGELKLEVSELRTDFHKSMKAQTAWLCGTVIAAMSVFAAVIALIK